MEANDIEPISDENWTEAAAELCRTAMTYETLLVQCLERQPELIGELIAPYMDDIDKCKAIVEHWRHF